MSGLLPSFLLGAFFALLWATVIVVLIDCAIRAIGAWKDLQHGSSEGER